MSTVGIIWDNIVFLCSVLPCEIVDLIANYARMSDLNALYYKKIALKLIWGTATFTFRMNFEDPLSEVDYKFTFVDYFKHKIHSDSLCLSLDNTSLENVVADCLRKLKFTPKTSKAIEQCICAFAHDYLAIHVSFNSQVFFKTTLVTCDANSGT